MAEPVPDVVVVGAGPNGLAAAIALARTGRSVRLYEAAPTVGGGCRSAELTLPGFVHDVCSAIHPMAIASPFFRKLDLAAHGLAWIQPPVPLAHPFDDGTAALLERSLAATTLSLDRCDADAYVRLMRPLVADADRIVAELVGPLRVPRHPVMAARFGLLALRSGVGLARSHFAGERARALFAGLAAHSMLALEQPVSAAIGLILGLLGHAVGWPLPAGGTQRLADALADCLRSHGGEIVTGTPITTLAKLPPAQAILLDLSPRQVLAIAGDDLPPRYRRQLARFRYGPGVFKVDWALAGPVPWLADACRLAGTVHLGGTMAEIAAAEAAVARGACPERPFVLLAQPSLFDPARAPAGRHTLWGYCHVPNGSTCDMTDRIEAQIERFAPGFRDLVLARSTMDPAAMARYDANYVGGDINGGLSDLRQLFTRPTPSLDPYATSNRRLYLCSASTPPGGGVHGLCGAFAARTALRRAW